MVSFDLPDRQAGQLSLLSFKNHGITVSIAQNVAKAFLINLSVLLVYSKAICFFIFVLRRYFLQGISKLTPGLTNQLVVSPSEMWHVN